MEVFFIALVLLYVFLKVKCRRERSWLGLVLIALAISLMTGFFPGLSGPTAVAVNAIYALLWAAATAVSIRFVNRAFREPRAR